MLVNYGLVILADILLAGFFLVNKKYEERAGCTMIVGLSFNVQTGFMVAFIMLIANGFTIHFTPVSLFYATLQTICMAAYTVIGFFMLRDGMVASYTLFLMTGGMVVPSVWGVLFLDETLSVLRLIGIFLIVGGVVLSNLRIEKFRVKYFLMGVSVFFLNGFTSVSSKMHQIETARPIVSSAEFVFLSALIKGLIALIILLIILGVRKKDVIIVRTTLKWKNILLTVVISVLSAICTYILVNCATDLPATVLFPVNTGGTIAFSAILGWIVYREKLTKMLVIGIVFCIIGTCFFL